MNPREELEILKRSVEVALDCFYENDGALIPLKVNEQCLVGNFYRYFCGEIGELLGDRTLRVDLEYNKCGREVEPKMRRSGKMRWRPDMIVHRRGDSTRNVCLFEFKRYDSRKSRKREDLKKLREAVDPCWLNYHFACYIEFGKDRRTCKVMWRAFGLRPGRDRPSVVVV